MSLEAASRLVVTRCSVPCGNTRSSRKMSSPSPGWLGTSTIVPTPLKAPWATTMLLTMWRSPPAASVTTVPLKVCGPLAARAALAPERAVAPARRITRNTGFFGRCMLPPSAHGAVSERLPRPLARVDPLRARGPRPPTPRSPLAGRPTSAAQRFDLLQDRLAVVVLALVGVALAEVALRQLRRALDDLPRRQRLVAGDRQILLARHRSSGLALGLGDTGHPADATRAA